MRVTGVDACRRGWVAVGLEVSGPPWPGPGRVRVTGVRVHESLTGVLEAAGASVAGIDMPLGLLESGWREADRAARGLLGPRRSSVFAIPPRAVWEQASYQAASQRCRELTGQGLSIQALLTPQRRLVRRPSKAMAHTGSASDATVPRRE